MTQNTLTPVAIGLALLAIVIGIIGVYQPDSPDVSGFISQSQHSAVLDRITELEKEPWLDNDYTTHEQVRSGFDDTTIILEELDMKLGQFQEEIVKNRDDIRNNHPFQHEPEELPVESDVVVFSSLLEIHMEKSEWLRGETIIFSGNALVNAGQVEALIVEPNGNNRYINAIVHQDGTYNFVFGTDFESEMGEYTISVSQRTRTSQTISFILGE